MNNLETQFLFKIDFSLRVLPEVFEKYEAELISHSNDMGLERITCSTDDELFGAVAPPQTTQQVTAQQHQLTVQQHEFRQEVGSCHHSVVGLGRGETDFIDYSFVYPDPILAAPTIEWPHQESHYPIKLASHHLLAAQQQPTTMTALDGVYPFPTLARQVSAHQVNAYQEHYPTELDPVNRYAAPGTAAAAAHQDAALSQYPPCQADYQRGTTAAPQVCYSPHQKNDNDPVYPSPASVPMTTDGLYPYYYHPCQDFNFATASQQEPPPVYSHHADYMNFNNSRTTRNVVQSHPEITPSPPPQPPMNFHGLPVYHDGEVGRPSVGLPLSSRDGVGASCGGVAYLTSSSSGVATALQHSHDHYYANPTNAAMALHHRQHQMLPSHSIAIGDHHQYHHQVTQDNSGGGWSMLSQALERGASLSGSA